MSASRFVEDLAVEGAFLVGYVVVGVLIVLVMRGKAPVWGGRAAKASILALIPGFFVFPPHDSRMIQFGAPASLLGAMALIVIVTGAGSRLSHLPASGQVRQASLAPRRLFVARVPHQRIAALIAAASTFVISLAGALTATDGTTLVRRHGNAVGTSGDYPGWPAAVPAMAMGAILLVAAWWAMREIEARPRISEPTDTLLRVRDASRVLRATTFGFATSASILLFAMGSRMNEATQHLRGASDAAPRSPWDPYQWVAFGLYVPAVVLLLAALFALGGSIPSREVLADLGEDTGKVDAPAPGSAQVRP